MKSIAAALLLSLAVSLPAKAAGESGLVTRIYPSGNIINFQLQGSCKTGLVYWQFDITTDMGKAWYAMLLTAANNKKPLNISFANVCDSSQHQTIWYMYQDF